MRNIPLILLMLLFSNHISAQDECTELLAGFIKHGPLWQFWPGSNEGEYLCSFAEDEKWGKSPQKKWRKMCVEEVEKQLICENKQSGGKRIIKDVSEVKESMSDDGILYYQILIKVDEENA